MKPMNITNYPRIVSWQMEEEKKQQPAVHDFS